MKRFFAYIRVSTPKQGEKGSSLQEQHAAIEGYAKRHGLPISEWFEERETAAKRGRPAFTAMLARLSKGDAHGLVIHKIDRGARNLRDWADLGELIDTGIDVHFANESLDLHSRGGRLSADIQAVVAADYIRNLKEEVRKGFYGRLKQGVYPLPAPLGYRDEGKGKPKSLDPATAPLVRLAFELYARGTYTLDTLLTELTRRGLRSRRGTPLRKSSLSDILNNEFYFGIMRVKRTDQRFEGKHPPLIPRSLFLRVQMLLRGNVKHRGWKHDFLFRQTLHCAGCNRFLIGERQKGRVYYRCQNAACKGVSLREDGIQAQIGRELGGLRLTPSQLILLKEHVRFHQASKTARIEKAVAGVQILLGQVEQRRARLTDITDRQRSHGS